ncbi:MAG TPA: tRNA glutamyl-Q(34) synthetase GluQRS [Pusillimonas sp.]|nr:tRNA glutamyl-Q(34) synthetase GluQRS [Pusillimonas sp.]MBC41599.1 tRNA glutamyl-Q(34) synthetase GluQRS [Pusillimonas sp.]HBT31784.1 tRNA glutamyl-Q(34) synthetase GluQRS [Pusillimonas sp.]
MARTSENGSYVGRFAPSPSGPLHDGSLVAAMAGYLDARARNGRWLLRIEDIDTPRVVRDADRIIMGQLEKLGMQWDDTPVWQSHRLADYETAFQRLLQQKLIYPCGCTRQEAGKGPYPGTCRNGLAPGRQARAWRFRVEPSVVSFHDRWLGTQGQDVGRDVGDFIIKRADGLWAYQLVVVIDDAWQGITDIVRGADLLSSTGRQIQLAQALGYAYPRVMHVPLVLDEFGQKLSKQNHAQPFDCDQPVTTLNRAWQQLGFEALANLDTVQAFWQRAIPLWASRFQHLIY